MRLLPLALLLACCQPPSRHASTGQAIPPPPFCTATLGVAECFAHPDQLPDHPPSLADGPTEFTPEQVRYQHEWWHF
jgi:hypothetical protein